jgi:hypothetical protein
MSKLSSCFLFVFVIISANRCFAQQLNSKQEKIIRQTIASQFGDAFDNEAIKEDQNAFKIIGNDTLFNLEGFHYVFKLIGDSAVRLDHSIWHGGNFRRFLFTYDTNLFALGGYGFFTTNNNLEYFNYKTKEWSVMATAGQIPPFINGLTFKKGDDIYTINNCKGGNAICSAVFDTCVYTLNLKSMVWKGYTLNGKIPRTTGHVNYLTDYCFQIGEFKSILLKPSDMSYVLIENQESGIPVSYDFEAVKGNLLILKSEGDSRIRMTDTLDLDKLWQLNKPNAKTLLLTPLLIADAGHMINWYYLLLLGVILSLIVLSYCIKNKRNEHAKQIPLPDTQTVPEPLLLTIVAEDAATPVFSTAPKDHFEVLLQSKKTILLTEELDLLLGIHHLESDCKKLKRHRILSEIEKNHPGFLHRIKDPMDKRRFSYQLNSTSN